MIPVSLRRSLFGMLLLCLLAYSVPAFSADNAATPDLFSRQYRVDSKAFLNAVKSHSQANFNEGEIANESPARMNAIKSLFESCGVDFSAQPNLPPSASKSFLFNEATGVLLIRATLKDLDKIETLIETINLVPPQVSIEAKIIRIQGTQQKQSGFYSLGSKTGKAGGLESLPTETQTNAATGTISGILTDPQFKMVVRALEDHRNAKILAAPKVITTPGKAAMVTMTESSSEAEKLAGLPNAGISLEALPFLATDGFTIKMDVKISIIEKFPDAKKGVLPRIAKSELSSTVTLWDGQTAVLHGISPASGVDGAMPLIILLTPTLIDPSGARVHRLDQAPYDPNKVPNQKPTETSN